MKCPTCNKEKHKGWLYCPYCGKVVSNSEKGPVYVAERLPYVLGKSTYGKFLFENFSSLDNLSKTPWMKVEKIRPTLDNFAHSILLDLSIFSFLYLAPRSISEIYKIGQFVGHSSVGRALAVTKLDKPVSLLSGTGLFWKFFEFEKLWTEYGMGWKKVGSGLIQRESINKKEKYIKVSLRNSSTSIISFKKPLCFWYAGVLSGQMDCFFSGYWSAHEEQCSCTPKEEKCIFKLTLHEKEIEPITPKITKEEIKDILGQLIDNCIQKKKNLKGEVGDYQHLMMHQATNYPLISSSRGHEILVKQAGNYIGQEIIKKTETNDINEAIEIMKEQFTYLKAGILNFKKDKEGFKIKLEDSVYSSGVNDINMKLDTFLAGIIEGALNQSTGEKWQVNETKCLANGDDYCEFTCRRQDR